MYISFNHIAVAISFFMVLSPLLSFVVNNILPFTYRVNRLSRIFSKNFLIRAAFPNIAMKSHVYSSVFLSKSTIWADNRAVWGGKKGLCDWFKRDGDVNWRKRLLCFAKLHYMHARRSFPPWKGSRLFEGESARLLPPPAGAAQAGLVFAASPQKPAPRLVGKLAF